MFNRAEVVDRNFQDQVARGEFPSAVSPVDLQLLGPEELIDLFETQVISRVLDLKARELKKDNLCYYTIGSSGHEGNAAFAKAFRPTDMAFLHYRSAAFYLQRAKQVPGTTPIFDTLLSFMASGDDPISGGRHKVIGSKPLFIPPQTSTIASHLPKAVGAALSIYKAKDLGITSQMPPDSVVLCSFGDASANHSTALGAINTACWVSQQNIKLPLVFFCEDNGIGISVKTPNDWIRKNFSHRPGMYYFECDGLNLIDVYQTCVMAAQLVRSRKKPVFIRMRTVRLLGHAGSDVETNYRSLQQIQETESQDPLLHSARTLIEHGILSSQQVLEIYQAIKDQVNAVTQEVLNHPPLKSIEEVASSITACHEVRPPQALPTASQREKVFAREWDKLSQPQHMAKLINWGLTDLMLQYPHSLVFGEDVAEKGGVYHVTDNLKSRFRSRRVFNSPLDEQSILGTAIGLAHNGFLPIPEIQFLAYVHNAEDQIRGEAATLAFFSQGLYTNPMVIRVAGLAYQKGFGGHFHNDNSLAVFRDIPGLIIAVPSNGRDAVLMLRRCLQEAHERGRVCVFVEPIALYMTRDLHQEGDKLWTFNYPQIDEVAPLGQASVHGEGDFAILTYGNGTYLSLQAQKILKEQHYIHTQVIDLKWIAPLDWGQLKELLEGKRHILFVEECRQTGSLAEGVISGIATKNWNQARLSIHGAADCFIPLGPAATAGLPSRETIVQQVLSLEGQSQ
jgi:2-oxoisovalerate dehydrogenase E1 component